MFNYIYTTLLTIIYTLVMSLFLSLYLKKHQKNDLLIMIYFLVIIIKGLVISMSENFHVFADDYNRLFMINPIFDTIYYLAIFGIALKLTNDLICIKLKRYQCALYITFASWLIIVPFMADDPLKVWLYYLPSQLLTIYLGGLLLRHSKFNVKKSPFHRYVRLLACLTIIFGILICLEDSFVIYYRDNYRSSMLQIQNRNISEDLFHITLCMLSVKYVLSELLPSKVLSLTDDRHLLSQSQTFEEDSVSHQATFAKFIAQYGITQREGEILALLIAHKHNQEIANQLYLSLGTVKTHTHNIFIKLQVERRTEVCQVWEAFLKNESGQVNKTS